MPDFRFWGKVDPRGRTKPPIVAYAPAPEQAASGEAVLRLYDPIDSWGGDWGVSAAEFLQALAQIPGEQPIRLHLNSPGGEVYDAIAILNALRARTGTVTAVVDGIAASAASFIAAGVDRLVMAPNSELMIHDAWGIAMGPAETFRRMAGDLDRVSNNIASIYATKAGTPVEDWRAAMLEETWYGAQDAVDAGLADEVGTGEAPTAAAPAAAAAAFDLSIFRNRGRAAAAAAAAQPRAEDRPYPPTPRQTVLIDAFEAAAETFGKFDQTSGPDGAHYMAPSPFAGEGLKCSSCLLFDGAGACEVVAGVIDPEAVCKLWTIPADLLTGAAAPAAPVPAGDPGAAAADSPSASDRLDRFWERRHAANARRA